MLDRSARVFRDRLFAPGPVEVPPQVLAALARPVLHHRTPGFRDTFRDVRAKLAEIARVPGDDVLILAGSGTAAFEAGLLACVPRGAKLVAVGGGKFAERWAELARTYGFDVVDVPVAWGRAADPHDLAEALARHPDAAAVTVTHSETSTGVLHDVAELASTVREHAPDALVLVDCVTSMAVAPVEPQVWGLDGVFFGSQKGLLVPPGLAFAWLSPRAWERSDSLPPSFYLDLRRERPKQQRGETAYTPAVNLVVGLQVALDLLLQEGIESLWSRRERHNRAVLAAGEAIGLARFAERASPAVAALRVPDGVAAPEVVAAAAARGARIAGGQDAVKPWLLRPSVLGWFDGYDAVALAAVLEDALRDVGHDVRPGTGVRAAMEVLARDLPRLDPTRR